MATPSIPHSSMSDEKVDDLIIAMEAFRSALRRLTMWPWSKARQDAVIIAFNTVLELHARRLTASTDYMLSGPYARTTQQLGRHEKRIAALEHTRAVGDAE